MKVVYRADDGTEFEDKIECENYEFEQSLIGADLVFLRYVGDNMDVCGDLYNAEYVDVLDEKSAAVFIRMNARERYHDIRWRCKSVGEETKVPPGVYYWEDESESFELFDDKIANLTKEIADLEAQKRDIIERAARIRKEREK